MENASLDFYTIFIKNCISFISMFHIFLFFQFFFKEFLNGTDMKRYLHQLFLFFYFLLKLESAKNFNNDIHQGIFV